MPVFISLKQAVGGECSLVNIHRGDDLLVLLHVEKESTFENSRYVSQDCESPTGKKPYPTAGILDSQSSKTLSVQKKKPRYDAGKR